MTAVTIHSNFGAQEYKVYHCFYCFPIYCHEVMELDAMILFTILILEYSKFTMLCLFQVLPFESGANIIKMVDFTKKSEYWKFMIHIPAWQLINRSQ